MRTFSPKTTALVLALALILCPLFQALAAETAGTASTVQLSRTEGTVTVTNSGGKALTQLTDMHLYNGNTVATEAESYAWLTLDSTKLNKLDAVSEAELRKSGKKLEVLLNKGNLFFNVTKPLEDQETLNIRTSTMVVGIRGTCGWVKVIDQHNTLVYVLEGTVWCTVTDPLSGQSKTTALSGGETARFTVYDRDWAGDKCDIIRERFTEEDIDGFVLAELLGDGPMCEKIYADSGLDLRDLTEEAVRERLEQDRAETAEELQEQEELAAGQDRNISRDPVWTGSGGDESSPGTPSRGTGGGSSSGGTPSSPATPVTPSDVARLTMPVTDMEVQQALNRPGVRQVIVSPGTDPARNTLDIGINMDVAAGKTLTLESGVPAQVRGGLNVDGTADFRDNLDNSAGTVTVNSANTLRVGGDLTNGSALAVTATGRTVVEGSLVNRGTLTPSQGARVLARLFTLVAEVPNWSVSGAPDGQGYYSLVYTGSVTPPGPVPEPTYTITFDANGGTVTPASGTTGTDGKLTSLPTPTQEGYTFDGWFTAADGGTEVTAGTVFTSNTRIFAHWTLVPDPPEPEKAALNGVVYNARGQTIISASVILYQGDAEVARTSTGRSGEYAFADLEHGEYIVEAQANLRTVRVPVTLTAGETLSVDLTLPEDATMPLTAAQVQGLLDTEGSVSIQPSATPAENKLTVNTDLTVDSGKTLTLGDGIDVDVNKGNNLSVDGTLDMPGSIVNNGTVNVSSGNTLRVRGDLTNNGAMYLTKTGRVIVDGTFTQGGSATLNMRVGAQLLAKTYTGNTPVGLDRSTGVDAEGYYTVTAQRGLLWEFDEGTGTLRIFANMSGRLGMDGFSSGSDTPWSSYRSDIKTIIITDDLYSIGRNAFAGCDHLTNITLPDSLAVIETRAFSGCTSLTSIEIPKSTSKIEGNIFSGCTSLNEIKVAEDSAYFSSLNGVLFDKDRTKLVCYPAAKAGNSYQIPDSVTSIEENAFYSCSSLTSIEIPDGVTTIKRWTFWGCSGLTNIEIPDSVTTIGAMAFYNCSGLTSVTLGNNVTIIGDSAFSQCSDLTSINLPDSVTRIGNGAFYLCSGLASIVIPGSVTSIGDTAFSNCSGLTSIEIPHSVTSIGRYAFSGCSGLTSIEIPDGVTSIEAGAFSGCSGLTSIEIPDGVTSIGDTAFSGCSGLTSIKIPDGVTTIGYGAFWDCSGLTSIKIPDGVTCIEHITFRECDDLTSITIPNSVTSIEDSAFYACNSLTDVYYSGTGEDWAEIAMGADSFYLTRANIHYKSTGPEDTGA